MSRFEELTLAEFAQRLRAFTFTRSIRTVHMHHTFRPTQADYRNASRKVSIIEGMHRFHITPKPAGAGFADIAQHLSIAPDGKIWTGRDWNRTPASAEGHNTGAFMFETIGDFDVGRETLTPEQRRAVVGVIALVQLKCGLAADSLRFHREFPTPKSCPGTGIRKDDILAAVVAARAEFAATAPRGRATRSTRAGASRMASAYEATPSAADATVDATVDANAAANDGEYRAFDAAMEQPFDVTAVAAWERRDDAARDRAARDLTAARELDAFASDDDLGEDPEGMGERGGQPARGLDAATREALRPHVVNLRQGRFSGGGEATTSAADVDAIFDEHLPAAWREARQRGEPLRLLFWAHGGLVSEAVGLEAARKVIPWWRQNGVYPIYFVWETGLWETLTQLLRGSRDFRDAAERGLSDATDAVIERLVHVPGEKVWGGMKHSAAAAVAADGGARYVAGALARFLKAHPQHVELHAVGHSAGAIFHSHFVPAALEAAAAGASPTAFTSVQLLAPAIRVGEFLDRVAPHLAPHLAPSRGIERLALFAMDDRTEQKDNCGVVYRKSLLYLIHHALEAERGEPILGLQKCVLEDARVRQLLGVDDANDAREVIWSPTAATGGRSASRSTSHGGFDNDAATMESVLRRVLSAEGEPSIEPFPESAQRDLTFVAADDALAELLVAPTAKTTAKTTSTPTSPPARAGRGKRRALCVGINYANDPTARLRGCIQDSTDWAEHLRKLGFTVEHLVEEKATTQAIRDALTQLVKSARSGDQLVFQYAGHGTQFDDRVGDETDRQDEALVPYDFRQAGDRFLLDDEQLRLFEALPDGATLTCFYDCCHSGTMARAALRRVLQANASARGLDREMGVRFIDPTPEMVAAYRQQRAASGGARKRSFGAGDVRRAIAFSACRDDEVALEFGGHGDFTRLATPLLLDAVSSGVSNAELRRRIGARFDTEYDRAPAQHPGLDCAADAEAQALLGGAWRGDGDGAGGVKGGELPTARERDKQVLGLLDQARTILNGHD